MDESERLEQNLKESIKEQKEIIRIERDKLNHLEEKYGKDYIEEKAEKYVNRFFKIRNSYSCPREESDYWWRYIRILKVSGRILTYVSFETDKSKRGKIHICDGEFLYKDGEIYSGLIEEITREEYSMEFEKMHEEIKKRLAI